MGSDGRAAIAERLRSAVVEALEGAVEPAAVRLDTDLLGQPDLLVDGRPLDSLDLVHIFTVIEDDFAVSLGDLPDTLDELTLDQLASLLAQREHGA
jgi:acyl carrier protein